LKEAAEMIGCIMDTLPKDSGGGGGKTMDQIVKEICQDYVEQMPEDFIEEIYRAQVAKLKGPPNTADRGFAAPLNIFLFQELQRLQRIIAIVRNVLTNLGLAIDGNVVMTPELLAALNCVFDAKVPTPFTHDPSGAEISWLSPSFAGWFSGLLERQQLLNGWLLNDRNYMKTYWITGFTNAQGFLTGMRQEVTRQHKKDGWALDEVVTHTEVMPYDKERAKDVPEEGQNVSGLFMEGARWSRQNGCIEESEPKVLFVPMPVIFVTACTAKEKRQKLAEFGSIAPYDCAVYKYKLRNDRYLIFRLFLKSGSEPAAHWRLRGVTLLAQID